MTYDLTLGSLPVGMTLTRASTGWYFNSTPAFASVGNDVARFDYNPTTGLIRGLLNEPTMTEGNRNNNMTGGVAGTPGTGPTNWNIQSSINNVTRTLAFGTEDGIPYCEVRYFGTPTAGGSLLFFTESNTGTPAVSGQTWTSTTYLKLQAGSLTGLVTPSNLISYQMQERSAAGAGLVTSATNMTPSSGSLRTCRVDLTRTLNNASTAFIQGGFSCAYANGVAIDFTLRLGLPSLKQVASGTVSTSGIQTSAGAVTRAADVLTIAATNGTYDISIVRESGTTNLPATVISGGVYTVPTDPSPLRSVAIGTTTISPSGSGTVTFGGTGITSGAVNSIGSGSGVIVAGVPNQSAITAAGVGSAAIVGRGIPGTSISGIGSGSASFAGRSIVGGAVASTGLGSAAIGGRLLKPARLSAAGVSGAALVSRAGKVAIVVSMGQGRAQFGGAYVSIIRQRIPVKSIRILFEMIWPDDTITRLWDGSGPFVTEDGNIWIGLAVLQGLDAIELAMNGEASTLTLALTGTSSTIGDLVWLSNSNDEIIGAKVRMMIQQCDADDQPIGTPEVRFTGTIDNIVFDDRTSNEDGTDGITSTVTVEVTNLFTLRRLLSGSVLSDIDQQARSLITNPTQTGPDRSCERVPLMADQTIVWPRWN